MRGETPSDVTKELGGDHYQLEANQEFLNFQKVEVTQVDESKPWKPAKEVMVTKADGTAVKNMDANTPFFTFQDKQGKEMVVTAATAGHIDDMHIKAMEPGSKFDEPSLEALLQDAAAKMPEGVIERPGIATFDVEMGKHMGREGIAGMTELQADGTLDEEDVKTAQSVKEEVTNLNLSGNLEQKKKFIEDFKAQHPDCKVQFQIVRESAIVPVVDAPKRDTTKLFVMVGPDASGTKKSLYTVAPGRNMPRHPIPGQHTDAKGVFDKNTFNESAEAWFDTVMLTGK